MASAAMRAGWLIVGVAGLAEGTGRSMKSFGCE
jgi:hypothetical protein